MQPPKAKEHPLLILTCLFNNIKWIVSGLLFLILLYAGKSLYMSGLPVCLGSACMLSNDQNRCSQLSKHANDLPLTFEKIWKLSGNSSWHRAPEQAYSLLHLLPTTNGAPKQTRVNDNRIPLLLIHDHMSLPFQLGNLASHLYADTEEHFDIYAVDFNREPSGISGLIVRRQARFINACIDYLQTKFANVNGLPNNDSQSTDHVAQAPKIGLVGYSMGGVVSMASLVDPSFKIGSVRFVLTLASPLNGPVAALDPIMKQLHSQISQKYYGAYVALGPHEHVDIVSLVSGKRDLHPDAQKSVIRNGFIKTIYFSSCPGTWSSPEHENVLVCSNSVQAIGDVLRHYWGNVEANKNSWGFNEAEQEPKQELLPIPPAEAPLQLSASSFFNVTSQGIGPSIISTPLNQSLYYIFEEKHFQMTSDDRLLLMTNLRIGIEFNVLTGALASLNPGEEGNQISITNLQPLSFRNIKWLPYGRESDMLIIEAVKPKKTGWCVVIETKKSTQPSFDPHSPLSSTHPLLNATLNTIIRAQFKLFGHPLLPSSYYRLTSTIHYADPDEMTPFLYAQPIGLEPSVVYQLSLLKMVFGSLVVQLRATSPIHRFEFSNLGKEGWIVYELDFIDYKSPSTVDPSTRLTPLVLISSIGFPKEQQVFAGQKQLTLHMYKCPHGFQMYIFYPNQSGLTSQNGNEEMARLRIRIKYWATINRLLSTYWTMLPVTVLGIAFWGWVQVLLADPKTVTLGNTADSRTGHEQGCLYSQKLYSLWLSWPILLVSYLVSRYNSQDCITIESIILIMMASGLPYCLYKATVFAISMQVADGSPKLLGKPACPSESKPIMAQIFLIAICIVSLANPPESSLLVMFGLFLVYKVASYIYHRFTNNINLPMPPTKPTMADEWRLEGRHGWIFIHMLLAIVDFLSIFSTEWLWQALIHPWALISADTSAVQNTTIQLVIDRLCLPIAAGLMTVGVIRVEPIKARFLRLLLACLSMPAVLAIFLFGIERLYLMRRVICGYLVAFQLIQLANRSKDSFLARFQSSHKQFQV